MNKKIIHTVFEDVVRRSPQKVAITSEDGSVSYRELNEFANKLAHILKSVNANIGTIVNVVIPSSIEFVASVLSIFKAGGVILPIDLSFSEKRLSQILENTFDGIIITTEEYKQEVINTAIKLNVEIKNLVVIDDQRDIRLFQNIDNNLEQVIYECNADSEDNPTVEIDGESSCYIYYTSGSTGDAKAILGKHVSLSHFIHWEIKEFQMNESARISQLTQITFDASLRDIFTALISGGTLCIPATEVKSNPMLLLQWIREEKITVVHCVPSLFRILTKELQTNIKNDPFYDLQYLFMAGEGLYAKDITSWRNQVGDNTELVNLYGPTEATMIKTFHRIREVSENPGASISVGRPISNTVVAIIKDGRVVKSGEIGEIYIKTPFLTKGYYNNAKLTAEYFVQNPLTSEEDIVYKTGDLGRYFEDGTIEVLGRLDSQVKVNGIRVELIEIEQALLELDNITETVIKPFRDDDNIIMLIAYYTGEKSDPEEIINNLSQSINQQVLPTHYIHLEEFPLNLNGKIDKKALSIPEEFIMGGGSYEAPEGIIECKLEELWKEVLGLSKIGRNKSFFSIGGHSLRAIQLITRISKELDINLKVADVFSHRTIKDLAIFISNSSVSEYKQIPKAEVRQLYPLSSAQKRLYFLQQFAPRSTVYNMPLANYIGKEIDKKRISEALNELIQRHESLRTSFEKIEDEVYQKIHPSISFVIDEFECEEEEFNKYMWDYIRPFNLDTAPLLRSALVHIIDKGYIWIIDIHHISSDGTSHQVLTEDFLSLYNREELPELRLQYKDFSEWQNGKILRGELEDQKTYWLGQFANTSPKLNLPTDRPRPTSFNFKGDNRKFIIDEESTKAIRAFGAENGCTLQMTLLSVLNVLLHKYTGQNDIVVGCGIAGRRHQDLEKMVGMFVNSLAIRNYPTEDTSFDAFSKEVITSCISAYENQDIQFEDLVDLLNVDRDASRNPLFDICMVVRNFERAKIGESANSTEEAVREEDTRPDIKFKSKTSKFDMTWFVQENDEDIAINLEYYSAIYDPTTIDHFITHFKTLLKIVLKNPNVLISDIDLLEPEEELRLLTDFVNGEEASNYPIDSTLHTLIEKQSVLTPNELAVSDANGSLTYEQLNSCSNKLGNFLKENLGVLSGTRIGVLQNRSKELIVSALGILKAGATYVPLDANHPEERLLYMLGDANIETLLIEKELVELGNRLQWRSKGLKNLICIDSENIHLEQGGLSNVLMEAELWDHVGETAIDPISRGGWQSSFTGEYLSKKEMDEYSENAFQKLKPHLKPNMKVLEIGCSSGLTMFKIAPEVGQYYGTDLSASILADTQQRAKSEGFENIELSCLAAHEIDQLAENGFDLVIINSVIQCFHGHNYLRSVLSKAINKIKSNGLIFLGDIMDEDRRETLITDMITFEDLNREKGYKTKTDWSAELFVSRDYLKDLISHDLGIMQVEASDKIYTIDNELTQYRYDALLVVDKKYRVKNSKRIKYQYDLKAINQYSDAKILNDQSGNDPAYVIYTSGSTGKPKGVEVNHSAVINLCYWHQSNFEISPKDHATIYAGIGFDASVWEIFPYLVSGASLFVVPEEIRLDVSVLASYYEEHSITVSFLPTKIGEQFLEVENSSLRYLLLGGDKLSIVKNKGYQVVNNYGPTEDSVVATSIKLKEDSWHLPIGRPIHNTQIYILTNHDRLTPIGIVGEICISGTGLASGYLNIPDLTANKFVANPFEKGQMMYKTGDMGRWLLDGNIEFMGRKDDQVKVRGYRVELGEIEGALLNINAVLQAVVIAKPDKLGENVLIAYLVGEEKIESNKIQIYLKEKLPEYMIPSHIVVLAALPLTVNGKIDRKSLPNPAGFELSEKGEYIAARNEVEEKLMMIWQEVLGTEVLSVNDDFFKLGGHSLKATKLSVQIHKKFNIKVPIKEVFVNTTIETQAEFIKKIVWLTTDVELEHEITI